MECVYQTELTS